MLKIWEGVEAFKKKWRNIRNEEIVHKAGTNRHFLNLLECTLTIAFEIEAGYKNY